MYLPDTSALIAGVKFEPSEVIIPESVIEELRDKPPDLSLYTVLSPSNESKKKVEEVSRKTGDYPVLSSTDIDILALALQEGAVIVTDDYAIQNVAVHMGIEFIPAGIEAIKEMRRWKWRCTGCGRYFRKYHEECPVCGSPLRRVKSKNKGL